jgi:hypothetical protein
MTSGATETRTVAMLRERFANADAFIANYGDRQESALFTDAKFLLAELDRAVADARRATFTEAWQAVDRAVRPLGTECGQSRWNAGYTQARNEAQNAILALRDRG